MSYDAIIFDSDGVFVRPTDRGRVREGVRTALESLGLDDPDPDHVDVLTMTSDLDRLEDVCSELSLDLETVWARREACVSERQRELLETGEKSAYRDIDAVAALATEYEMGVVSNNQHETVAAVLDSTGLDAYISTAYGREPTVDGLRRVKPGAHYFECVLEELGSSAPLYVGDSVTDLRLADRVGVDIAYIVRSHNENPGSCPTYVINSLRELPLIVECA